MSTTSDKLATGGAVVCWVLAIEGYDYLITNWTDTSAIATAWAATDWSNVMGGLEVRTQFEQEIRPLDPTLDFSSATFLVHDGPDDRLGTAVAQAFKSAGIQSKLDTDVDPSSTTITPLDDGDFPASGEVYIGAESIAYGAKSAGDLTTLTRGQYAPFRESGGTEWARSHSTSDTFGVPTFAPPVTDWKRVWIGSHVGLWLHVVEGGVVNVKADAKNVFAGVLSDISDEIGATRIVATDFRQLIGRTTLLGDQFSATLDEGVWLDESDHLYVLAVHKNTLTDTIYVEASDFGSLPARVTLEEIVSAINTKIAAASLSADDISVGVTPDGRFFVTASWTAAAAFHWLGVTASQNLGNLLGIHRGIIRRDNQATTVTDEGSPSSVVFGDQDAANPVLTAVGFNPAAYAQPTISFGGTLDLSDPTGDWVDQSDQMPEPFRSNLQTATIGNWGFLRYGDLTFAADRVSDTEFRVYWDNSIIDLFEQEPIGHVEDIVFPVVRYNQEPPRVKQVLYFVDSTDSFLVSLLASTGDAGYNEATHDKYPRQMSAAVPWDLLGDAFVESARQMAESGAPEVSIILEKPTTVGDLLAPELAMRSSHLIFKDGLRFVRYSGETVTPDHTLSDSDLSATPDSASEERPSSWWSSDFLVNAVKIEYDRSIGGEYKSVVEVVNATSQREYGAAPVTISARNSLTQGEAAKENLWIYRVLEDLGGQILATFDEPLQFVRMSVQGSKVFGMAPGDTVSLTSDWVRYALTGERGVAGVFGVLTGVAFDLESLDGEVTILLTGGELARAAPFSPAGLLDADYNVGNFTSGYDSVADVIKIEDNQFSLASEDDDVTWFSASDAIRIIERSPSTPGSPQSWDTTIDSIDEGADEITLTSALTGFDSTKQYYVISDEYSVAGSTQQSDTYIADDADDKIDGTDQSKTYRMLQGDTVLIAATGDSAGPYEFPPTDGQWSDAGNPLSPAAYQALARNANHLIGSRTAPEIPGAVGFMSQSSGSSTAFIYKQLFYLPVGHYGTERSISIGPRMSSTGIGGGNTVTVKVTSYAVAPPRQAAGSAQPDDEQRASQSVSFTSTSTTEENVASQSLPVVMDRDGGTWIVISMSSFNAITDCSIRGFHTFHVEEL